MLLSAWLSKLIINRFSHYRTWGIVFSRAEHAAGLLACRRLSLLLGASGPPAGLWPAAVFWPAPWRLDRPQARKALAALVLFVGRRYYLRPIIRRSGLLEQASAPGPPAGLSAVTRVRVCDGNAMNVR